METNFVFVSLMGGLGNQMCQYAAAYTVAKRTGAKIFLEECATNSHNLHGHNYVKEIFQEDSTLPPQRESLIVFHQGGVSPYHEWNPLEVNLPCRMSGYFQYYPAFQSSLPELVEKFRRALRVQETTDNVFLHVRRGDYLLYSHIHNLQTADYYLIAYNKLLEKKGYIPSKVIVFSDDIEWCKKQHWFQLIPNVCFSETKDELETLAEMATCGGGAIIANSTFSLWGAYLSKTDYVYYPKRWVENRTAEDIMPNHWVCV